MPVVLLSLAVTLPSRRAAADLENPDFLPFGERAAFVANAGLTSAAGEAVYYNPANLARIDHPNLSVSGNIYMRFQFETDALLSIDGEDQPFHAAGFIANPSTLISTYQIGSWSLATAVLIPEALTFKNRVAFASENLKVTLLQESQQESLWIGGGVAHDITPELHAGLSLFVTRDSTSQLTFLRTETVGAERAVAELTSNTDQSVLNLVAIGGLYWQAHPRWGIGLRARAPAVKLSGGADIYQASVVPGDDANTIEQEFEDVDVSSPAPLDLGAGLSFRATPRLELLLEASVQLPATVTTVDEPDIPQIGTTKLDVELAPRVSVGVDWQVLSTWWLRLGALYNRSALPEPKQSGDTFREDFYGATGGFAWQKDRTTTALGGFFLYSPIDLVIEGSDPVRRSEAVEMLYGALLTVAYRL